MTAATDEAPSDTKTTRFAVSWSKLGWTVILGAIVVQAIFGIFIAPISFDEGYNLQVPANLAQNGAYATNYPFSGDPELFDVRITTGPTLLLPIAGLFGTLGQSVWIARLVPTAGYLLLTLFSWQVGQRLAGQRGALAATAAMALVNASALGGPAAVLGEIAASGLIVAAALNVLARTRVAGLLLGFAILTKFLAVLALPCFALAIALSCRREVLSAIVLKLLLFFGWVALPISVWQLVRLVALGPSAYMARAREFVVFLGTHGSGTGQGRDGNVIERVRLLATAWPPGVLGIVILLGMIVLLTYGAPRSLPVRCGASRHAGMVTALGATAGLWLMWWFFVSDHMWLRHALPAVYLAMPLVAASLVRGLSGRQSPASAFRRGAVVVAVVLAGTTLAFESVQSIRIAREAENAGLAQQKRVAKIVVDSGVPNTFFVDGYWSPEIEFLSGIPSRPLGNSTGAGLLVLSLEQRRLEPRRYEIAATRCGHLVYARGGYVLCWTGSQALRLR